MLTVSCANSLGVLLGYFAVAGGRDCRAYLGDAAVSARRSSISMPCELLPTGSQTPEFVFVVSGKRRTTSACDHWILTDGTASRTFFSIASSVAVGPG
jgi:hypothetical protein